MDIEIIKVKTQTSTKDEVKVIYMYIPHIHILQRIIYLKDGLEDWKPNGELGNLKIMFQIYYGTIDLLMNLRLW